MAGIAPIALAALALGVLTGMGCSTWKSAIKLGATVTVLTTFAGIILTAK